MKKMFIMIIVVVLAFSTVGCGSPGKSFRDIPDNERIVEVLIFRLDTEKKTIILHDKDVDKLIEFFIENSEDDEVALDGKNTMVLTDNRKLALQTETFTAPIYGTDTKNFKNVDTTFYPKYSGWEMFVDIERRGTWEISEKYACMYRFRQEVESHKIGSAEYDEISNMIFDK